MEDQEVIEAFVSDGARSGSSTRVAIEEDALVMDGWFPLAFRVAPDVFGVREDEPPEPTPAVVLLVEALARAGLERVDENPALLHSITYSEIALGLVDWSVWARDRHRGERALEERAQAASGLTHGSNDLPF